MSIIPIQPININKFWEKTPTPLKYLLLVVIIVACSYFLISRKVDLNQVKELAKLEQSVDVTYDLVKRFNEYQVTQNSYNSETLKNIKDIYVLVQELNSNVNTKFDYIIKNSGKYNQDLLDKLTILNGSFEKLSKAYEPSGSSQLKIGVKKIEE